MQSSGYQLHHGWSSSVYTMVLGFGKTTDAERQALNQMADAGGFPVTNGDPLYRYYRAEDSTALEQGSRSSSSP
ncbi:MAG: hypothetical protein U0745_04465 [Polyangia bacterium]